MNLFEKGFTPLKIYNGSPYSPKQFFITDFTFG